MTSLSHMVKVPSRKVGQLGMTIKCLDGTSIVHGWCLHDCWIKAGMDASMLYAFILFIIALQYIIIHLQYNQRQRKVVNSGGG